MIVHARTRILLLALAALLLAKVGQQVYRWAAFGEERQALRELHISLDSAGLAVMRTQLLADSLRTGVHGADRELARMREELERVEGRVSRGDLPHAEYAAYHSRLQQFNRQVQERNGRYERWIQVVERNYRAVRRYNAVADSMRGIALRMGEPYYTVPTPAELAVRQGLGAGQ